MKGLIVCGYPGVGKSSIAGWNNCIDLESSFFSHRNNIPQRTDNWASQYCSVANDLALQGYTVLTSTHEKVIETFKRHIVNNPMSLLRDRVVIFCPDHRYQQEWIDRLRQRCNHDDNYFSKNARALRRAEECFGTDMYYLNNCGLPVYIPAAMDYDLRDYILHIRKKEGCDRDISKADSSVEEVDGMEEPGMDVPMVEKDSDTPGNQS